MPVSFAGNGILALDHSASSAKKPVTFAGVLVAQITPDARLPDLAGAVDQIVVCCV